MSTRRKRNPRFQRVPPQFPKVRIQERDAAILRHVYKHRCLRTDHIISLIRPLFLGTYGSDTIKRRLRELYDEEYLDLPPAQRRFFQPGCGNPQNVYALGDRGADVLERWFGIPRGKVDWSWKNNKVQEMHLEHTLLEADIMVAIELACRDRDTVRLLEMDDILISAPETTRQATEPFKWKVAAKHDGRDWLVPVEPDKVFALEFSDRRTCAHFFLEADRGTMTVEPTVKAPWKSSVYRKFIGYHATWQQKEHTKRFGMGNFRTLFVVQTRYGAQRVESFLRANKNALNGSGFSGFLFTDYQTLFSHPILEAPWLNGRGEVTKLTD